MSWLKGGKRGERVDGPRKLRGKGRGRSRYFERSVEKKDSMRICPRCGVSKWRDNGEATYSSSERQF
jgi:hypothetical protein